jgi:hypothetical protein
VRLQDRLCALVEWKDTQRLQADLDEAEHRAEEETEGGSERQEPSGAQLLTRLVREEPEQDPVAHQRIDRAEYRDTNVHPLRAEVSVTALREQPRPDPERAASAATRNDREASIATR